MGDDEGATVITLDTARQLVIVNATSQGNNQVRAGPLPAANTAGAHSVHAYVDHAILELIVNNETALVVYAAPSSSAGKVQSSGAATLDVWTLKTANENL